jgi:ABC-type dipeptide/oligopeptide/nickel transport system ATPase component
VIRHGSSLSRVGASDKPGAVQTIKRATLTIAQREIALRIDVGASALGRTVTTTAFARGIPRYDAEHGELFFDADDVTLENFAISNPAGAGEQPSVRLGGLISENLPRIKTAAEKTIATGVKAYLAARPVYRFKDDLKGLVLKATITDIAIEGNTVAISVSLLNLGVTAAVCLLALLVALVGVIHLVRHPSWGVRMQV